jgi:two-component SAPR family response regulator
LYQGSFLADDDAASWSVAMRERTRRHFLRLLNVSAGELVKRGNLEEAVYYYEQAIDIDNLNEAHYLHLMECYGLQGRRDQVVRTWQQCQEILQARLGVSPSDKLQTLYQRLMR